MSDQERLRRPELARSEPIRSWSGAFGAEPSDPSRAPASEAADLVSRSIEIGYRVIDEYIRQGQRAARGWSERDAAPRPFGTETQDFATRMLRNASDFASSWIELLGTGALAVRERPAGASSPSSPRGAQAPEVRADDANAPRAAPIRVEVRAERASQVTLELRPGAAPRALAVHSLRSLNPEQRALEATAAAPEADGVLRVSVRVPDDQPAGLYSGLILDLERGVPIGSLSVELPAPRAAAKL